MPNKEDNNTPEEEKPTSEDSSTPDSDDSLEAKDEASDSSDAQPELSLEIQEPEDDASIGKLVKREISDVMEKSYLEYAMSVIVMRALPDARDGLKPVHRRILYSMWENGMRHTSKHKKSANIVGEVLGKYHPHGDTSVYDSMVRMAQEFSLRYPFVDGQGNFGSIDGDSPAAYRYTEARLTKIAEEMLFDIDKDTVDWMPNYDASRNEPRVLPSKLPNLLLSGSEGIAVGMATRIPTHNLTEVVDAEMAVIDNPDITIDELMENFNGPDFPTGGVIFDQNEIKNTYATGRGRIVIRGVAEVKEGKNDKHHIIISELPYQVNKAHLIEKMAVLVRDKVIAGISDIRDESDHQIRVVIDLKKDAYPKKILNQLFKHTTLQTAYHVNMIALADGLQPRLMNLKEVLATHINHREQVITRRTQFELKQAEERAHVLEGLKIALDNIDAVIKTIRASKTTEEAHAALMKKFKLTDIQASAIMAMRLSALAGLERQKVEDELKEKMKLIKELKAILADRKKILGIVKDELQEIKDKYGDERRTRVMKMSLKGFRDEDLIPNEPMVITITKGNYIKRLSPTVYKSQRRGGMGVTGMKTKEEDNVELILAGSSHDEVLFFTNKGRVFKLKAYDIPLVGRTAKGQAIVNLLQLAPDEKVTVIRSSSGTAGGEYFFMATKNGTVKKTPISDFANVRASGLIAIKLREGDNLTWVARTSGKDEIMLVTKNGQSIRFKESDCRPMGRATQGVRGMKLSAEDAVVEMFIIRKEQDPANYSVFVISENGYGKRTQLSQYKVQNRAGSGIKVMSRTAKTGDVVAGTIVLKEMLQDSELLFISRKGQVMRTPLKNTPSLGRSTQGVIMMRLKSDKVASIDILTPEEEVVDPNATQAEQAALMLDGENNPEEKSAPSKKASKAESKKAGSKKAISKKKVATKK